MTTDAVRAARQARFEREEGVRRLARLFVVAIGGWDAPARPPADVEQLADRLGSWQGSAAAAARLGAR